MSKIGFIVENFFPRMGGMEIASYFLANYLNKAGTKTRVYCSAMPEVPKSYQYPFPVTRSTQFGPMTRLLYKANMRKLVSKHQCQLLHGHMLHGGGHSAVKLAQRYSIPSVVTSHGADVQVQKEIAYGAMMNAAQKERIEYTLDNCDCIVSLSSMNKALLLKRGADENKIVSIPLGVDIKAIQAVRTQSRRIEFSQDDFVLISVGRNSKIKRLNLLIEAMNLIVKETNKIKCLLVGPDDEIKMTIAAKGLQDYVKCVGKVPGKRQQYDLIPPYAELVNVYRSASLYVSTSYVEAFNLSALDALACGVPVLVTRNQGIRDHVQEDLNGYIIENEDAQSLSQQILEIYQDQKMKDDQRQIIIDSIAHLDWTNVAKAHQALYAKLLT